MATTNKLANAFAKRDIREQIQTLSHVLGLSLAAGIFLLLFVNLRGMSLLASILGPAGATVSIETATKGIMKSIDLTPEVLHASFGYVRIRSIASPLAIMGLTSQAALLAAQDTRTPVLAVIVASAVNIIGDYIFVAKMGWGIRGASLATCMASIMSNGMLVTKVWKMMGKMKYSYGQETMMEASSGSESILQSNYAHDALASNKNGDSAAEIPFMSFPDSKSFVSLLGLVGPMFFVMLFKICGYSAMTIRSGDFGMLSLACHSVMMRVFFFFATAGDAISQAAQTFLPGLLYQKSVLMSEAGATSSSVTNPDLRTLLKRLLLISSVVGIVNCFVGRIVALNSGRTFSNDAALVLLMSTVSPFMGLASLFHPFAMCLEGSIIAASDTKFLVGTYIASLFVLLTQLKLCKDFLGVWRCLLVFQLLRMSQFGLRVWKQTSKQGKC
jgi:Na+-driven multidrug efflux pump